VNKVLAWLKANIVTVIVLLVMLAAAAALPIVSGKMNAGIKAEVEKRANKFSELDNVAKTQVNFNIPGIETPGQSGVVNQKFLAEFEKVATQLSAEAQRVRDIAIKHNRQDRTVLMSEMFPKPVEHWNETVRFQFHEKLMEAYSALLAEVNAGAPPTSDEVRSQIEQRRELFLSEVGVADIKELDEEQRQELHEELTQARLAMYGEKAKSIAMYADLASLTPPEWDKLKPRDLTIGEWFVWQWDLWIKQDIMRALHEANQSSSDGSTVLNAPVKRVLLVSVREDETLKSLSSPAAQGGSIGGFGAVGGSRTGGSGESGGAAEAVAAAPPDPKTQAPLDYALSFTGRKSNPLYDVKIVDLELIVDSTAVPSIVDALARQNFMTILDLRMQQADPFDAVRGGYVFGQAPLAYLKLVVETVWLREWTSQLMPDDVKNALRIPLTQPPVENPAG
jgi:hypothetical protein